MPHKMDGFAPVFEQDGNQFIIAHEEFVAETEERARMIGLGSFVECVLLRMHFTGGVLDLSKALPHFPGTLGDAHIAVFSGPMFDEHLAKVEAQGG